MKLTSVELLIRPHHFRSSEVLQEARSGPGCEVRPQVRVRQCLFKLCAEPHRISRRREQRFAVGIDCVAKASMSVATMHFSEAMASNSAIGNPSHRELKTTTSAIPRIPGMSCR